MCPRCAHAFSVKDDAAVARCPGCALESDLVSETQAQKLGIDPQRGLLPKGVRPWGGAPIPTDAGAEEGLETIECPACAAPILVAPDESEGWCPHCSAELEFDHGEGFESQADADGPDEPSDASSTIVAETTPAYEGAPPAPPSSLAFDPLLEIHVGNAPLITCRDVRSADVVTTEAASVEGTDDDPPESVEPMETAVHADDPDDADDAPDDGPHAEAEADPSAVPEAQPVATVGPGAPRGVSPVIEVGLVVALNGGNSNGAGDVVDDGVAVLATTNAMKSDEERED